MPRRALGGEGAQLDGLSVQARGQERGGQGGEKQNRRAVVHGSSSGGQSSNRVVEEEIAQPGTQPARPALSQNVGEAGRRIGIGIDGQGRVQETLELGPVLSGQHHRLGPGSGGPTPSPRPRAPGRGRSVGGPLRGYPPSPRSVHPRRRIMNSWAAPRPQDSSRARTRSTIAPARGSSAMRSRSSLATVQRSRPPGRRPVEEGGVLPVRRRQRRLGVLPQAGRELWMPELQPPEPVVPPPAGTAAAPGPASPAPGSESSASTASAGSLTKA